MVGVSADALNERKKGRAPVFSQAERLEIVAALKPVDAVFVEESLELKRDYILEHEADILVMGDDWAGQVRRVQRHLRGALPASHAAISTTALIEKISSVSEWTSRAVSDRAGGVRRVAAANAPRRGRPAVP